MLNYVSKLDNSPKVCRKKDSKFKVLSQGQSKIVSIISGYICDSQGKLPVLPKVSEGEHSLTRSVIASNIEQLDGNVSLDEEVQDFEAERVTFHNDYNIPTPFRNDIAVIKLKGSVTQNGKCNN